MGVSYSSRKIKTFFHIKDSNNWKDFLMHPVLSHHSFFCNFQHLLFLILRKAFFLLQIPMLAISIYNNIFYLLHCILIVILFYVRKAQKNHRISSLQSAVFFLFPDGKPFKDGTFSAYCLEKKQFSMLIFNVLPNLLGRVISVMSSPLSHHCLIKSVLST